MSVSKFVVTEFSYNRANSILGIAPLGNEAFSTRVFLEVSSILNSKKKHQQNKDWNSGGNIFPWNIKCAQLHYEICWFKSVKNPDWWLVWLVMQGKEYANVVPLYLQCVIAYVITQVVWRDSGVSLTFSIPFLQSKAKAWEKNLHFSIFWHAAY